MKGVNRRAFLASLVIAPLAEAEGAPTVLVELESVSAFYAPHFEEELRAGTMLQLRPRHGRLWLTHRDRLIGSLPRIAASLIKGRPAALPIATVDRDENGRIRIVVKMER